MDAVRRLQEAHGLEADGIVGPLTAELLRQSAPEPPSNERAERIQDVAMAVSAVGGDTLAQTQAAALRAQYARTAAQEAAAQAHAAAVSAAADATAAATAATQAHNARVTADQAKEFYRAAFVKINCPRTRLSSSGNLAIGLE